MEKKPALSADYLLSKIEEANKIKPLPEVFDASDPANLAQDFGILLEDKTFSDYAIFVGPDNVPFPCHKCVLACRSPYFKALFSSGMVEANEPSVSKSHFSPEIFKKVLQFMYTGQAQISSRLIFDIYCCAEELMLSSLSFQCCEAILKTFETTSVLEILDQTIHLAAPFLHDACASAISAQSLRAVTNPKFVTICKEALLFIVQTCTFNCPEIEIFKACLAWAKHQAQENPQLLLISAAGASSPGQESPVGSPLPKSGGGSSDQQSNQNGDSGQSIAEIAGLIPDVAPFIRVNLIGTNDLRDFVEPSGLFSWKDLGDAYRMHALALANKQDIKTIRTADVKQQMEIQVTEIDEKTTKITWVYPDFKGSGDKRLFSEPFMARGKSWKLMVRVKPPDSFGLYISIDTTQWSPGDTYRMGYTLTVVNQNARESITRSKYDRMFGPPDDTLWGFDSVTTTSTVLNPDEGFLVNGVLRIEATMTSRE